MSKAKILEEFTKLTPAERSEFWEALWSLEEHQALGADAPTEEKKAPLDRELEDYQKNPYAGSSWAEVEAGLRRQS